MAHFTEAQAVSSFLESCRKEFTDGDFSYWVLRVSGSDGQHYQFVDHELAEDATLSQIKNRLIGHLTGSTEYYVEPTPPVISSSAHFPTGIGKTLG
jgi:hypothetical protein